MPTFSCAHVQTYTYTCTEHISGFNLQKWHCQWENRKPGPQHMTFKTNSHNYCFLSGSLHSRSFPKSQLFETSATTSIVSSDNSRKWKWKLLRNAWLFATPWTVHGILQARILEWVAFPFSRGSSWPRKQTRVSHIAGGFLTNRAIVSSLIRLALALFMIYQLIF